MKIVTIPKKMSGTGSIRDLASQHYNREIRFPKGAKYAVVLASYYGGRGYTTHRSESATIQADKRNSEFSRRIIGVDGYYYEVDYDGDLVRDRDQVQPLDVQDFEEVTSAAAALGGIITEETQRASRENGAKGGRPRKPEH